MVDFTIRAKVDEKHGVVDGRDLALKLMTYAYRLLGAYAQGDSPAYERLKGITEYLAELEIHMQGEDVPQLMIVTSDRAYDVPPEQRWQAHAEETAGKTKNLLDMSASVSGRHRSLPEEDR